LSGHTSAAHSSIDSLRSKVLIPFFLILTAVGAIATIVSLYMITDTLARSADTKLIAFQQQIDQEIRTLETDLLQKSELFEIFYRINQSSSLHVIDRNAVEKLIKGSLLASHIRASFVEPQSPGKAPVTTLGEMFAQAEASHKKRIRFTTDFGTAPALTLVTPIIVNNRVEQFILLQATLDQAYLKQIADPLQIKITLFGIDGEPLVKSHNNVSRQQLGTLLLQRVLDGEKLFMTDSSFIANRIMYSVIPLDTTDKILLAITLPMTDMTDLIASFFSRAALTFLTTLLICSLLFYRQINKITKPIEDILSATRAIADGNLDCRLQVAQAGEFKQLAHAFNNMMTSLSTVHADRIRQERELTIAQEGLRYKDLLENKNREIESYNKELAEHNKELSVLLQITQEMSSTLDLDTLFANMLNSLRNMIGCQTLILLTYDPGSELLEVSQTFGIDREALADVTFKLTEGISGESARTKKTIYAPDLKIEKRYLSYKKTLTVFGSMISIPLITHDRLCGVLNLHKDKINSFDNAEIAMCEAVASQAAIAIENVALYNKATELSITDELTGLANRRHFQNIFDREIILTERYATTLSLIMIDIDHFKKYNDYHGHLQGDVVLKKVADCLLHNTRGIDLTCRFGGEEFIILLPKTTSDGAMITAEKLRRVIEAEHFNGEEESQPEGRLTLSLGVASYPDHTSDIHTLLELADQALYRAKDQGRNRVVVFSPNKKTA